MIRLLAAFALFFVSGFAALVYQVVWQRLLAFFSGADVYSATIVVAAFMSGLGCGSFAGGQVGRQVITFEILETMEWHGYPQKIKEIFICRFDVAIEPSPATILARVNGSRGLRSCH